MASLSSSLYPEALGKTKINQTVVNPPALRGWARSHLFPVRSTAAFILPAEVVATNGNLCCSLRRTRHGKRAGSTPEIRL